MQTSRYTDVCASQSVSTADVQGWAHPSQIRFPVEAEHRGVVVTEASSYLRLIDSCIDQLKARRPAMICEESKEEEEEVQANFALSHAGGVDCFTASERHALLQGL